VVLREKHMAVDDLSKVLSIHEQFLLIESGGFATNCLSRGSR
jgi:hypothetical protein